MVKPLADRNLWLGRVCRRLRGEREDVGDEGTVVMCGNSISLVVFIYTAHERSALLLGRSFDRISPWVVSV